MAGRTAGTVMLRLPTVTKKGHPYRERTPHHLAWAVGGG
ncbi:hypothetical protein BCO18430_03331 [Burkholderia contaminans]|nr:hypothetical protein BCO18430_03331 [Burkholderia contaminans]